MFIFCLDCFTVCCVFSVFQRFFSVGLLIFCLLVFSFNCIVDMGLVAWNKTMVWYGKVPIFAPVCTKPHEHEHRSDGKYRLVKWEHGMMFSQGDLKRLKAIIRLEGVQSVQPYMAQSKQVAYHATRRHQCTFVHLHNVLVQYAMPPNEKWLELDDFCRSDLASRR